MKYELQVSVFYPKNLRYQSNNNKAVHNPYQSEYQLSIGHDYNNIIIITLNNCYGFISMRVVTCVRLGSRTYTCVYVHGLVRL